MKEIIKEQIYNLADIINKFLNENNSEIIQKKKYYYKSTVKDIKILHGGLIKKIGLKTEIIVQSKNNLDCIVDKFLDFFKNKLFLDINEHVLKCLIEKIFYLSLNEKINSEKFKSIIDNYCEEINNKTVNYSARIYLKNYLYNIDHETIIENESYKIILKKITKDNFNLEIPLGISNNCNFNISANNDVSGIIEINFKTDNINKFYNFIDKLHILFRLFDATSVHFLDYTIECDSICDEKLNFIQVNAGENYNLISLELNNSNIENFKEYFNYVIHLIPDNISMINQKDNLISLCYKNYYDAIFDGNSLIKRISSCIMGLECLFMTNNNNSELMFRLNLRINKLFQNFILKPLLYKKIIDCAYSIRCDYVHGNFCDLSKKANKINGINDIDEIAEILLNTLRIAINIFLFLKINGKSKEEFIELMDDASFDDKKNDELQKKINSIQFKIFICQNII